MKNDSDKPKKVKVQPDEDAADESADQIAQLEDKYKRVLADYQNLQRRSSEERMDWIRSANKELLLRILAVYDTLVLAKSHIEDEGLQVVINQFSDVLKNEGVVRIETVGKEFNPHLMEAIAAGEGKEGFVTDEIRAGFLLHDKLLRPAQVKVGKSEIG